MNPPAPAVTVWTLGVLVPLDKAEGADEVEANADVIDDGGVRLVTAIPVADGTTVCWADTEEARR